MMSNETNYSPDNREMWSKSVRVLVGRDKSIQRDRIKLVTEKPLNIVLNTEDIVTLLCIPDKPVYLAVGFLFSEGLITSVNFVKSIEHDRSTATVRLVSEHVERPPETLRKRVLTTGCGKGTTFSYGVDEQLLKPFAVNDCIDIATVFYLMKELMTKSRLYQETHGVHNTALAYPGGIELFHTDVGRHNAVDKIYGQSILEDHSTKNKLLLTTGRLTSEIVVKCARMGISTLISRHAATNFAVELATQLNMTLVGYVRGAKLTIYAGFDRIKEARNKGG